MFDDGTGLSQVGPLPAYRFLGGAEANLSYLILKEGKGRVTRPNELFCVRATKY